MAEPDPSNAPKPVVVGVDESSPSMAGLLWAAAYADKVGAVLRIVHVWDLTEAELFSAAAVSEAVAEDARVAITREVSHVLGSPPEGEEWPIEVLRGQVGPTLVRAADRADLLVVGTGAHTGLRRLAAGSVSHYCLSHAHCPVVAVPAPLDALAESS